MDLRRGTTRLIRLAVALVIVVATPAVAAAVVLATQLFVPLPAVIPEPEELEAIRFSQVYDADGQLIHTYQQFDQSIPVTPGDIPAVVKQAVIAAEDRNFYGHDGVDIRGTVRALVTDVREGEFSQGGSTITQQLAKNAYGVGRDRTVTRKVREAVLAAQLDRSLSKEQILYEYLSIVYFGEGAYGIGAAADVYFDKPVNQLDLSEAATLAALIPAPSRYNPRADIATAEQRRRRVLDIMREEGMVTPEAWNEAASRPLWLEIGGPAPGPHTLVVDRVSTDTRYPWFIQYLTEFLTEQLGDEDVLYRGGLQIHTTLDPRVQAEAEATVAETLDGVPAQTSTDPATGAPIEHVMQMSVSAIEPPTGFVRALVGGRDFALEQSNLATGAGTYRGRGRQTGSSFKPIVLAEAFEQGIQPEAVYSGAPHDVGGDEPVTNYGGARYGNITLRSATTNSVNTVFTRLIQDVSVRETVDMAARLGLPVPPIDAAASTPNGLVDANDPSRVYGLSVALGALEMPPLAMASAYGVFANHGLRAEPTPVLQVLGPDGDVIIDNTEAATRAERVIAPEVADNVTDVLRGVVTDGTAAGRGLPDRPSAGKTGTAQFNANAWFVGYTPTLSTATWFGYRDCGAGPDCELVGVAGVSGNMTGGSAPARLWQRYMNRALEGVPVTEFAEPAPIPDVRDQVERDARGGFDPGRRRSPAPPPATEGFIGEEPTPEVPLPTTTTTSTTVPGGSTSTTRPLTPTTGQCQGLFCPDD